MTSRDFCFWLQGYLEITDSKGSARVLTAAQLSCVQQHLALVFKHEIDPSMGSPAHQQELNKTHHPSSTPNKVLRC
jgi:hypothetical protein